MDQNHLLTLASEAATHLDRSIVTIAKNAGLHGRIFTRIRDGKGCRVDTFNRALSWFDANWPADLEWPQDVPRPSEAPKRRAS